MKKIAIKNKVIYAIAAMIIFSIVFNCLMPLGTVHARDDIRIIINGHTIALDKSPVIDNGRTLVPLRAFFEYLGADVQWDEISKSISIKKDDVEVHLWMGKKTASINGTSITIDAAPKIIDESAYVPLRFLSQSLAFDVQWIGENNSIVISNGQSSSCDFIDNLKPLEKVQLFPDNLHASDFASTSRPGSVRNVDYDGGRYIVFDVSWMVGIYDLWTGVIKTGIAHGTEPKINGNYITYASAYQSTDESIKVYLYQISTGKEICITPDQYEAYSPKISTDGKYISFIGLKINDTDVNCEVFVYSIEKNEVKSISKTYTEFYSSPYEMFWCANKLYFKGEYEHKQDKDGTTIMIFPYWTYDPVTMDKSYFKYNNFLEEVPPSFIRGSGDWLTYELWIGDGVYALNTKSGELRHVLDRPQIKTGVTFYPKVFFPVTSGNWITWTDSGDFYSYSLDTGKTVQLSENPKDRVGDEEIIDNRYYYRRSFVYNDLIIFYGADQNTEIMKLK